MAESSTIVNIDTIHKVLVSIYEELKAIKEQNANINVTFSGMLKANGNDLTHILEKTIRQSARTVGQ